jgi:hypothetical protein
MKKGHDSQCSSQNLNQAPTEQKSGALPLDPPLWYYFHYKYQILQQTPRYIKINKIGVVGNIQGGWDGQGM